MPESQNLLNQAAAVATIAACVVAVIALVLAGFAYLDAVRDSRISATLGYAARLKTDPLASALGDIRRAKDSQAWKTLTSADARNASAMSRDSSKFISDTGLDLDAVRLADFFDDFYSCVEYGICDLKFGLTLLGPDLEGVFELTRYFIKNAAASGQYLYRFGCGQHALRDLFFNLYHSKQLGTLRYCRGLSPPRQGDYVVFGAPKA